jgi:ABC-type antimicrobial peptide transport system permease subunit
MFTRPGLGKMLVDAIGARDYPLAQGAITVFTMIIIVVNLAVDMLMAFPTLLLALIIVTALGSTLLNEIMAIGIAPPTSCAWRAAWP